ncbi:CPBP family intramembrane metalloprotease [bacterium]|nr:CPBP family intramembrane metalloprotease [bacterium]
MQQTSPEIPDGSVAATAAARPLPAWIPLLCALLVIGPYWGLAALSGSSSLESGQFELPPPEMLLYQALGLFVVFGGLSVLLHVFACRRPLKDFNQGEGSLLRDLLEGVGVFALLMMAVMAVNLLLMLLRGETYVSGAVSEIARALASSPLYMAVFLGPVVWLQAAVLEELSRSFLLLRLWQAFPASPQLPAVLLSSILFGLAHIYQGWEAVPAITAIGLILGLYFQRRRRLLPLVIAHGLFDTTVMLIATYFPEMLKAGA